MSNPFVRLAAVIVFAGATVAPALSATTAFTVNVPVSLKGFNDATFQNPDSGQPAPAQIGMTVYCAIGGAALGLLGGAAQNALAQGSTKITFTRAEMSTAKTASVTMTADVGAPGSGTVPGVRNYLCWSVIDSPSFLKTPINFINSVIQ